MTEFVAVVVLVLYVHAKPGPGDFLRVRDKNMAVHPVTLIIVRTL